MSIGAEEAGFPAVSRSLASAGRARPRVAILTTWHPEPVDNGRKQRTRQIIDAFASTHDIVLVSLLPPGVVRRGPLPPTPGVWRQYAFPIPVFRPRSWSGALGFLSLIPRSLVATWSRDTAEAVSWTVAGSGASVVIGTNLQTLRYLDFLRESDATIRAVLDEPDVSPFETAPPGASRLGRARHSLRYHKYRRLLRRAAGEIDAFVVASEHEAHAFERLSGASRTQVIANGVSRFPTPWRPLASRQLLYTGSLTYAPNAEAVEFYSSSILPYIAEKMDGVTLAVTGALPDSALPVHIDPSTRLTGRLDDLEPMYRESRVFIAPILSGTGTRIKLLEAMAIGIPIVTTSKGIEGIPVTAGTHALIADDPREFADATLSLLSDDHLAQSLGANGRAFVMQHGNWETSAAQFRRLIDGVLHGQS
ncbi:MAG TPA: glycosyltransferase family 4 protein [Thermomicrobiales bacterium]|nr:glycosyltransferase family 4 protein [Thermomicrobiales bacterium]